MTKAATVEKPALKMMRGSEGNEDYLYIARRGNIAFGVKPLAAMPGAKYGVPAATYFIVRVRAAPIGKLEEEAEGNVVQLQQKYKLPHEAWPEIEWQKNGQDRASTILSMFVKGTLGSGPELEQLLIDNTKDKAVGKKLSNMLVGLIGEENMVVKPRHITDYTDEQFMGAINNALEHLKKKKQVQEHMFAALSDNFGVESKVLKDVYAKLNPGKPADEVEAEKEEIEDDEHESSPDEDEI